MCRDGSAASKCPLRKGHLSIIDLPYNGALLPRNNHAVECWVTPCCDLPTVPWVRGRSYAKGYRSHPSVPCVGRGTPNTEVMLHTFLDKKLARPSRMISLTLQQQQIQEDTLSSEQRNTTYTVYQISTSSQQATSTLIMAPCTCSSCKCSGDCGSCGCSSCGVCLFPSFCPEGGACC